MTVQLYFGPYDDGTPILPGKRPDWMNPHDPDTNNHAISITEEKSEELIVTVTARNHGEPNASHVTVRLEVGILPGPLSLLEEWDNVTVPAYNRSVDNRWTSSPVKVRIPRPIQGIRFVPHSIIPVRQ